MAGNIYVEIGRLDVLRYDSLDLMFKYCVGLADLAEMHMCPNILAIIGMHCWCMDQHSLTCGWLGVVSERGSAGRDSICYIQG